MKNIPHLTICIATIFFICISIASVAQYDNHREQIIISKDNEKFDTHENVSININKKGVFVNGNPIEDFEIDGLRISIKKDNPSVHWKSHKKKKAFLGVMSQTLPRGRGVLIKKITPNSAAEEAGLLKGDIILTIDNRTIESEQKLIDVIRSKSVGDKITIKYMRDGRRNSTMAKLKKWENRVTHHDIDIDDIDIITDKLRKKFHSYFDDEHSDNKKPKIGLDLETLEIGDGLKVTKVEEGSYAEKAGFEEGDMLVSIDNNKINGLRSLRETIHEAFSEKGKSVTIEILRNKKRKELTLLIPRAKRKISL